MGTVSTRLGAAILDGIICGGMVYVPYGGLYGDCGPYHGFVVGVKADGSGGLLSYAVPSGREAGGAW